MVQNILCFGKIYIYYVPERLQFSPTKPDSQEHCPVVISHVPWDGFVQSSGHKWSEKGRINASISRGFLE